MSGLIGKKIGMTSIYDENGKNLPCTVIEAGPCVVTQVKTDEVDGYSAVQLGFNDKNENTQLMLKQDILRNQRHLLSIKLLNLKTLIRRLILEIQ